jgi:hypothetical protein
MVLSVKTGAEILLLTHGQAWRSSYVRLCGHERTGGFPSGQQATFLRLTAGFNRTIYRRQQVNRVQPGRGTCGLTPGIANDDDRAASAFRSSLRDGDGDLGRNTFG